jgi:hypothetical protein
LEEIPEGVAPRLAFKLKPECHRKQNDCKNVIGLSRFRPGTAPVAPTLDRVHAAMLLQAGGQATALRAMLEADTQRSPDFLRLTNALSALYPKESEEKRLLDAMLLAAPK